MDCPPAAAPAPATTGKPLDGLINDAHRIELGRIRPVNQRQRLAQLIPVAVAVAVGCTCSPATGYSDGRAYWAPSALRSAATGNGGAHLPRICCCNGEHVYRCSLRPKCSQCACSTAAQHQRAGRIGLGQRQPRQAAGLPSIIWPLLHLPRTPPACTGSRCRLIGRGGGVLCSCRGDLTHCRRHHTCRRSRHLRCRRDPFWGRCHRGRALVCRCPLCSCLLGSCVIGRLLLLQGAKEASG